MKIETTRLDGIVVIEPKVFGDLRGFFYESYHYQRYCDAGIRAVFVQDNQSRSVKNTLRGLHYQVNPGQGKLIRVIDGEIFDVAVDVRWQSPTFGQWFGINLSAENKKQLYIPVGFAHGFCVLSDFAEINYKCTDYYSPADERGILWNDPMLAINWPVQNPILSARDQQHPRFTEIPKDF
jgi:dTDP-4-dehydrorhamnose 3,5-epimerase